MGLTHTIACAIRCTLYVLLEYYKSTHSLYNVTPGTGRNLHYVECCVIQKVGMNIGNMYIEMLLFTQRITRCHILRLSRTQITLRIPEYRRKARDWRRIASTAKTMVTSKGSRVRFTPSIPRFIHCHKGQIAVYGDFE